MIVVGSQSTFSKAVETTYLGRVLSLDATGSSLSGKLGQLAAKISYVRRHEQETLGFGERIVDRVAHVLAEVGKTPSPVLEPAVAILVGAAGCLHDPVEGHERRNDDGAHGSLLP